MEAIHPKAAKTLRQADVPLRVTNAFEPDDPGTLIDDQPAETPAVEIVTGLDIIALEVFEQDMVGVKGYDAAILDVLTRHDVRIVSKVSNANTITHYVDASLKSDAPGREGPRARSIRGRDRRRAPCRWPR